MTNKIYYQAKNPAASIAFADWINEIFNSADNGTYWTCGIHNMPPFEYDNHYTTIELYQIWENLNVPEELLKNIEQ